MTQNTGHIQNNQKNNQNNQNTPNFKNIQYIQHYQNNQNIENISTNSSHCLVCSNNYNIHNDILQPTQLPPIQNVNNFVSTYGPNHSISNHIKSSS